ncbi:hypothetical protein DAPPUDRAFT_343877, partial [Daphnia pulex]
MAVSPVQAQEAAASAAAPTEAVAPAADAAPVAQAAAKPIDNPYGLQAMIAHGDMVSKGVLALLLIMSMGS